MKGLLIKDLRLVLQQKRFFLLLFVLAIVLNINSGGTFAIGYLTFVGSFFVINTISSDANDDGYLFLMSLPIMRQTYAREKYLFAIMLGAGEWFIGLMIAFVSKLVGETAFSYSELLVEAIILIPIFFTLVAIMLPIQLKFGAEKGKIVLLIVFGVVFLSGVMLADGFEAAGLDLEQAFNNLFTMNLVMISLLALAAAIAVLIVSCAISTRIMMRKEF